MSDVIEWGIGVIASIADFLIDGGRCECCRHWRVLRFGMCWTCRDESLTRLRMPPAQRRAYYEALR